MRLPVALAAAGVLLLAAGPAPAAVAPGRLVLPIAGEPVGAAALPDGGTVVVVRRGNTGVRTLALRADGSPAADVADVSATLPGGFRPNGVLRRPDGRLLLTGTTSARFGSRQALVQLTPAGALDTTFAAGGLARTPVWSAFLFGASFALQPDGAVVVTGRNPAGPSSPRFLWTAVRVTVAGALDPSFGGGTVQLPTSPDEVYGGDSVAVTPAGRIVLMGLSGSYTVLTALTTAGAPDPEFNGGVPLRLPPGASGGMLLRPGGEVDVLGRRVTRVTATGTIDTAFGRGAAALEPALDSGMLATPDGGTLVYAGKEEPLPPSTPRLTIQPISATGQRMETIAPMTPFGGGYASADENAFAPRRLIARPDGSFLALGTVAVGLFTGEHFQSTRFTAIAALTPALVLDRAFGGPPHRVTARVRVLSTRARDVLRAGGVRVEVTASAPGMARLNVRDAAGRRLAARVVDVPGARRRTVIPLSALGRRVLSRGARAITVTYRLRDVLAAVDTATTRRALR